MNSQADPVEEAAWQARLPFYYGWVIVAVVFLRSFTTAGSLWVALGILSVPMHDDLGWSRTVIFASLSLRTLGAAFSGVVLGKYVDRAGGPRILATVSGVIAAATLLGVSVVNEPWQFLFLFGVLGGLLGNGPAMLLNGALVPKWFIRQRGRAGATASMGSGFAGFLLAPVLSVVSDALGWRSTWIFLSGLVFLLAVLPSLLLKTQPEDIGQRPDGDAPPAPRTGQTTVHVEEEVDFTAAEAFRTSTLWLLIGVAIFGGVSSSAYPASLVSALADKGFSTGFGAAALSGYGLFSFGSRFLWGYFADRVHIRKLLLVIAVYSGSALPLVLVLPGDSVVVTGAITGAGIGGWVGLNQIVWATYFGRAHLGSIVGKVRPFITLSGAMGPLWVAALADLTGSYTLSFSLMALSWWLSGLCLLTVKPPGPPERMQPESEATSLVKSGV